MYPSCGQISGPTNESICRSVYLYSLLMSNLFDAPDSYLLYVIIDRRTRTFIFGYSHCSTVELCRYKNWIFCYCWIICWSTYCFMLVPILHHKMDICWWIGSHWIIYWNIYWINIESYDDPDTYLFVGSYVDSDNESCDDTSVCGSVTGSNITSYYVGDNMDWMQIGSSYIYIGSYVYVGLLLRHGVPTWTELVGCKVAVLMLCLNALLTVSKVD